MKSPCCRCCAIGMIFFCSIKPHSEPCLLFETVQFRHDRFLHSFVAVLLPLARMLRHFICKAQSSEASIRESSSLKANDVGGSSQLKPVLHSHPSPIVRTLFRQVRAGVKLCGEETQDCIVGDNWHSRPPLFDIASVASKERLYSFR